MRLERHEDKKATFDPGRRDVLKRVGAVLGLTAVSPFLITGDGERESKRNLEEWRWQEGGQDPEYGENWNRAIELLGVTRLGDIRPYHNASTLRQIKNACRGDTFGQIETDLYDLEDGSVIVAHSLRDYYDTDLKGFHNCVDECVFSQGRFKLIEYDFKTFGAYLNSIRDIAEFNRGRPHIINAGLYEEFRKPVTKEHYDKFHAIYPDAIWSAGSTNLGRDLRELGPVLVENIKSMHEVSEGSFTYVIEASDFVKYHEYMRPFVEAEGVLTIAKSNGWALNSQEIGTIIEVVKPWQVICDFGPTKVSSSEMVAVGRRRSRGSSGRSRR